MTSPYDGYPEDQWQRITQNLLCEHPLDGNEIVDIVLSCWQRIFQSKIGDATIGKEIFPKPQMMGFFLHELIPRELAARYPGQWREERGSSDKDIVFIANERYSIEVKTSSHASQIFGNRSFAQQASSEKKAKDGYYLTVNFEKFGSKIELPAITIIRFGWLDSEDWIGQTAATGQQSKLTLAIYENKFSTLYQKQ